VYRSEQSREDAPKKLIARLSRVGSQQQDEVPEALLSLVPCARCKRWECEKKQQIVEERERVS
jgi:hypothetical protein